MRRAGRVRPVAPGEYPGIIFYSEIFQVTGPIRRTAAMLAGTWVHCGYAGGLSRVRGAPGVALAYDQAGSDRGNFLKTHKPVAAYDSDTRACLEHLLARPDCTGKAGGDGDLYGWDTWHFGRRLSRKLLGRFVFMRPISIPGRWARVSRMTLLHGLGDIKGELFMAWGRQDPHVPVEGRMKILARLNETEYAAKLA